MKTENEIVIGTELKINAVVKEDVTPEMLDGIKCILRCFLEEGSKVADIGCGQSFYLQEMVDLGYSIHAVDNDPHKLKDLREDLIKKGKDVSKIIFWNTDFLLPTGLYWSNFDAVIFSQLFHLFKFEEVKEVISEIVPQIKEGAIIHIRVHSKKHPANGHEDNKTFESFYSFDELRELFPPDQFESLIEADVVKEKSNDEIEMLKQNCLAVQPKDSSEPFLKYVVNEYIKLNTPKAYLVYVVRKKSGKNV